MKKLIAGTGVVMLLVAGAGAAAAQTGDTPTDPPAVGPTDAPGPEEPDPICARHDTDGRRDTDRTRPLDGAPRFGLRAALIEALGITQEELRTELAAGKTLAQIGEEGGVDIAEVIGGVVAEAEARVAENPDSRLAQRFDAQELSDRLTDLANRELDGEGRRGPVRLDPEEGRGAPPTGFEPVLPA